MSISPIKTRLPRIVPLIKCFLVLLSDIIGDSTPVALMRLKDEYKAADKIQFFLMDGAAAMDI